jgi:hypothetical protein
MLTMSDMSILGRLARPCAAGDHAVDAVLAGQRADRQRDLELQRVAPDLDVAATGRLLERWHGAADDGTVVVGLGQTQR